MVFKDMNWQLTSSNSWTGVLSTRGSSHRIITGMATRSPNVNHIVPSLRIGACRHPNRDLPCPVSPTSADHTDPVRSRSLGRSQWDVRFR